MLGRKKQAEAVAHNQETAFVPMGSSEVVELRRVEDFRACPVCLVVNSPADTFCTGCGAELPTGVGALDQQTLESSSADDTGDSSPGRSKSVHAPLVADYPSATTDPARGFDRRHAGALAGVICLFAAAVGVTAWGWQNERSHSQALHRSLVDSRRDLRDSQAKLAATASALSATRSVSQRRKDLLSQAQGALAQVDPLLSSVDALQKDTSGIQVQRDTFTADANTLKAQMITLANYVIQTDPSSIDSGYLQQLIDTANADLSIVNSDEASLGAYDSRYSTDSDHFANRATAFTKAVRTLQQQLQAPPK
jgi:hypothetical protein